MGTISSALKSNLIIFIITLISINGIGQTVISPCSGDTIVLQSENGDSLNWKVLENGSYSGWQFQFDKSQIELSNFHGKVQAFKDNKCTVQASDTLFINRGTEMSDFLEGSDSVVTFKRFINPNINTDTIYLYQNNRFILNNAQGAPKINVLFYNSDVDSNGNRFLNYYRPSIDITNKEVVKIPTSLGNYFGPGWQWTQGTIGQKNYNNFIQLGTKLEIVWEECNQIDTVDFLFTGIYSQEKNYNWVVCADELSDTLPHVCFYISSSLPRFVAGEQPKWELGIINKDSVESPELYFSAEMWSAAPFMANYKDTVLLTGLRIPSLQPGEDYQFSHFDSLVWPFYLASDLYTFSVTWEDSLNNLYLNKQRDYEYSNDLKDSIKVDFRIISTDQIYKQHTSGQQKWSTEFDGIGKIDTLKPIAELHEYSTYYIEYDIINNSNKPITSLEISDSITISSYPFNPRMDITNWQNRIFNVFAIWPHDTLKISFYSSLKEHKKMVIRDQIGDTVALINGDDYFHFADTITRINKLDASYPQGKSSTYNIVGLGEIVGSPLFPVDSLLTNVTIGKSTDYLVIPERFKILYSHSIIPNGMGVYPGDINLKLRFFDPRTNKAQIMDSIIYEPHYSDLTSDKSIEVYQIGQYASTSLKDTFQLNAQDILKAFPGSNTFITEFFIDAPKVSFGATAAKYYEDFKLRSGLRIDSIHENVSDLVVENVAFSSFKGTNTEPPVFNENDSVELAITFYNEVSGSTLKNVVVDVLGYNSSVSNLDEEVNKVVKNNTTYNGYSNNNLSYLFSFTIDSIPPGDTIIYRTNVLFTDSSKSFIVIADRSNNILESIEKNNQKTWGPAGFYCKSGVKLASKLFLKHNGNIISTSNYRNEFYNVPLEDSVTLEHTFYNYGNVTAAAFDQTVRVRSTVGSNEGRTNFNKDDLISLIDSSQIDSIPSFSSIKKNYTFKYSDYIKLGYGLAISVWNDADTKTYLCSHLSKGWLSSTEIISGNADISISNITFNNAEVTCGVSTVFNMDLENLNNIQLTDSVYVIISSSHFDTVRVGVNGVDAFEKMTLPFNGVFISSFGEGVSQDVEFKVTLDLSRTNINDIRYYTFNQNVTYKYTASLANKFPGISRTKTDWDNVVGAENYVYNLYNVTTSESGTYVTSGTTDQSEFSYNELPYGKYESTIIAYDSGCGYSEMKTSQIFTKPIIYNHVSIDNSGGGSIGNTGGNTGGGTSTNGACWSWGNSITTKWIENGRIRLKFTNPHSYEIHVRHGVKKKSTGKYSYWSRTVAPGQSLTLSYSHSLNYYYDDVIVLYMPNSVRFTCKYPKY